MYGQAQSAVAASNTATLRNDMAATLAVACQLRQLQPDSDGDRAGGDVDVKARAAGLAALDADLAAVGERGSLGGSSTSVTRRRQEAQLTAPLLTSYESTIHPLTILSALPFAGFGALLSLMLFGFDLNVYAFVGVILLVGLVKKNGIMLVDFSIEASKDGANGKRDAIHQACLVRFRPIRMTTLAARLGTLPIALGSGAGAESRQPLGVAVVDGLLFSQMLTLYVTPISYLHMEDLRGWLGHLRAPRLPAHTGDAAIGAAMTH
jgi:hypothetical protein